MDGTKKFGRERGNLDFREEVGFRETSYLKVLNRFVGWLVDPSV